MLAILIDKINGNTKEIQLPMAVTHYDDAPGIIIHKDQGYYCVGPREKGAKVAYESCHTWIADE